MKIDPRTWVKARGAVPALLLPASIGLFWISPLLGGSGLLLTFFLLVARFDNRSGTFQPLAVLFVIMLLTMALLLAGLAHIRAVISAA